MRGSAAVAAAALVGAAARGAPGQRAAARASSAAAAAAAAATAAGRAQPASLSSTAAAATAAAAAAAASSSSGAMIRRGAASTSSSSPPPAGGNRSGGGGGGNKGSGGDPSVAEQLQRMLKVQQELGASAQRFRDRRRRVGVGGDPNRSFGADRRDGDGGAGAGGGGGPGGRRRGGQQSHYQRRQHQQQQQDMRQEGRAEEAVAAAREEARAAAASREVVGKQWSGPDADRVDGVDVDAQRSEWRRVGSQNLARQERAVVGRVFMMQQELEDREASAHRRGRYYKMLAKAFKGQNARRKAFRQRVRDQMRKEGVIPALSARQRAHLDGSGVYYSDVLHREIFSNDAMVRAAKAMAASAVERGDTCAAAGHAARAEAAATAPELQPAPAPGAGLEDERILAAVGLDTNKLRAKDLPEAEYRDMVAKAHRAEHLARSIAVTDPAQVPDSGPLAGIHNFTRLVSNNPSFNLRQREQTIRWMQRDLARFGGAGAGNQEPPPHNEAHGYQLKL